MQASIYNFGFTEQIQNVVIHHPHLKQREVRLETAQGRVRLTGSVKSYFEKQMAQEALRNVEGVETIENQLTVEWPS